MNIISIIKLALSLLPLIIEAIKAIEAAMPDGGNGEAKLEVIKNTVEAAYSTATEIEGTFNSVWPTLNTMVSTIVKLFNTVGLFKKLA